MNAFRKWAKRLGLTVLAALAVLAVLWGISRTLYPTDEQRDALALIQLPAPPPGENAFAAMWTLDRAVPPDEMSRVIELDAARIAGLSQFPDPDNPIAKAFVSAAEQYPDLAPSPQGLSVCTAMRGEFELMSETTRPILEEIDEQNWWSPLYLFLLYDAEATKAAQARNFAPMCAERELERIAADQPEIEQSEASGNSRFACLGNFTGCFMSANTAPAYSRYRIRMQDFGARLELLATLAWLRENGDRPYQFRQEKMSKSA